jgi:hypothetical protein
MDEKSYNFVALRGGKLFYDFRMKEGRFSQNVGVLGGDEGRKVLIRCWMQEGKF